jgi:hypothetical protein
MVDTHQSYEDFQLDALIQYDLADDDDDYNADTDSIHSNAVDDAAFHELYDSIPAVVLDTNDANSTSKVSTDRSLKLPNVTKMIRPPRLQIHKLNRSASSRSVQSADDYIKSNKSKQKSFNKKHSLILSVGKILLPKRNSKSQSENRLRRGIERNVSCRTEGSTVSWISDDLSKQLSHVQLIEEDMSSTGSQCYLDDDDNGNDSQSNCCNEVFVDECYKIMMGNDSNDNKNHNQSNDTLSSDEYCVDDDRFLNRSLPIIESRGLQSLFYATTSTTPIIISNNNNKKNQNIDISNDDDSSEEQLVSGRRPYTMSDF